MGDVDSKIQEIIDKEAIRELVHIYCRAADRHDHVLMRKLYHEDAYDDHGSFFKGKAMEFIDMLPEIQKSMGILHHNVTTHNIKMAGNKAEGETYIIAFHQVLSDSGAYDVLIGGRYFDEYEKRDGIWKFSSRAVDADWAYVKDPSQVNLAHPMIEGANLGRPDNTDPSYKYLKSFRREER
ncbi:nuclear transport factor 2 family protein [Gammaproteobacteria bacterium]|nr:nuclear transport factor 2 family protein [Gammaproteobacteria bacterium]MDB9896014.1 nuclear transport factor 2 family protein [Gammaproteobacteria bacterium]MDC1525780.1 nuclear transport factor 2 family protein [Gammaproteobacteria bacterium]